MNNFFEIASLPMKPREQTRKMTTRVKNDGKHHVQRNHGKQHVQRNDEKQHVLRNDEKQHVQRNDEKQHVSKEKYARKDRGKQEMNNRELKRNDLIKGFETTHKTEREK